MKRIFLLPLTLTLLTACYEPSKTEYKPYVPPEYPNHEVVYEGSSGIVSISMPDYENEVPVLPSQISVSFEKENSSYKNLNLEAFDGVLTELLFSKQPETHFFGCANTETEAPQETVLPLFIDAARVVLCGKIKIPSNGFRLRATQLELRNVELSSVALARDESDYTSSHVLSIYAANLTLTGTNKLVLQGLEKGRERERAPALLLRLAKVWGNGTLEIFSRSSIQVRNF